MDLTEIQKTLGGVGGGRGVQGYSRKMENTDKRLEQRQKRLSREDHVSWRLRDQDVLVLRSDFALAQTHTVGLCAEMCYTNFMFGPEKVIQGNPLPCSDIVSFTILPVLDLFP